MKDTVQGGLRSMIRVLVFMRMGPGIGLNWNTIAAVAILLNLTGHFCTAAFLV
ncbi:MAG: hypothetical protein VYD78_06565 [Gemmatimonadota bacterium]|nr:hypothetical protein [Gemmatimonadota bacterium]